MTIQSIVNVLEQLAPTSYQESYDNAGLLTGTPGWSCTGVLCTLDATEDVVLEAISAGCNLVVAHHPIIFGSLKKLNGDHYIEKSLITAIKNDIAIYAIHTNLDNILQGVNGKMADVLGLINREVLVNKPNTLMKLVTFVPNEHAENVRAAAFNAGAGNVGNYGECSFNVSGTGTFKPGAGSQPFVGEVGKRHEENEIRIEMVFPAYLQKKIIASMTEAHPYEEVAYDIISLTNSYKEIGSGLLGELAEPMNENQVLEYLKNSFDLKVIRHTPLLNKPVKKVALCGGAGSFLIKSALLAGADLYITADVKYHEFFEANSKLVIADIGHYESEQYTTDLLHDVLTLKFPTFAVLKSKVKTNPVQYYL